ncbi:MAG TPA: bifunctional ADP-heptose synthase [Bacteroidia bacterium]|nr:bifunctional ADP-heptose synthase [Bacteroidia bacterium]
MNPAELKKIFDSFNKLKVLIIGDLMVDVYYWGDVSRISPEAPVPIVAVSKKESRMGGAANVAINIQAMGATPILCGVIGDDSNGEKLLKILKEKKLPTEGIVVSEDRPTTTKTRIISSNHHIVRIDDETDEYIGEEQTKKLLEHIEKFIKKGEADVIIFEDYDKGVISASLIKKVVSLAKKYNIPTVVDPKKRNFTEYHEVTLFKPNLKELKEGLKVEVQGGDIKQVQAVTERLRKNQRIANVLVTLSEYGVFINSEKEKKLVPAHIRNISDVSGAGDTVVSIAALCSALNLPPLDIAFLSNLAGGQVCEKTGVVPVDKKQLLKEALQFMNGNK